MAPPSYLLADDIMKVTRSWHSRPIIHFSWQGLPFLPPCLSSSNKTIFTLELLATVLQSFFVFRFLSGVLRGAPS
jgi:hypothetical protein